MSVDGWRRFLPGLWAGWLLCVALLATPAPFALLAPAEAGRIVGRMLAQEAYTSLALGALFCTVAGYFAVQPMMAAARAGSGPLSFGQLHAVSATFYALKLLLVVALAALALRRATSS